MEINFESLTIENVVSFDETSFGAMKAAYK